MTFKLPDELPATVGELDVLIDAATQDINVITANADKGEGFDPDELNGLVDAVETLKAAREETLAENTAHTAKLAEALSRAAAATTVPEPDVPEVEVPSPAEVVAEAERIIDTNVPAAVSAAEGFSVPKPVSFAGTGTSDVPEAESGPGWVMLPGAPGYKPGKVGFKEIAEGLDALRGRGRGHGIAPNRADIRSRNARGLMQLSRGLDDMVVHDDVHTLRQELDKVTSEIPGHGKANAVSLTAAGGWCAPSEQLYTFCDVPEATDLISLPNVQIRRGGLRWPVEPDLTAIFNSFQFFYTEPQLEAVDGNGDPTAIKTCVEVPCPDTFEEIRLNAVGYCVEAGILQREGWPESIEWFMRSLAQEHLRAMSRRKILDMVAGSGAVKVVSGFGVGATSQALNVLALMATNLRLNRGLGRSATIEGVAPSWFHEVLRADLAMAEGLDVKSVSDGQVSSWLTARNIALQFVGDWQTRSTGLPGNLSTMRWPGHVDILLYPMGTWFESLSNVIEMGVLYPKEQLQVNRYTELFVEDAYAVGKRCNQSIDVRIPLCVNGGYGAPVTITCTDTTTTRTLTFSGGPTGGTFTMTYDGRTTSAITYTAAITAATVKNALVALDDAYTTSDFTVTGANGGPFTIVTPGGTTSVTPSLTPSGTATIS